MLDRPADSSRPSQRAGPPAVRDPLPPVRASLFAARRHWRAIALVLLCVPALSWLALAQITPRFKATGTLLYDPPDYSVRELQSIVRADPTTDAIMTSQAEIARSLATAERIVDQLGLMARPEFNPALRAPTLPSRLRALFGATPLRDEDARRAAVLTAQDRIAVKTVRASRIMELSFSSEDRTLAASAANLAMALYRGDQLAQKFEAVRRDGAFLAARVAELRHDVADAEDRIAAYRAAHGLAQGVQAGLRTEQASRLNTDLVQARGDLALAQSRLDAARGQGGSAAQSAIAPSVVALRAQQDQQDAALASSLSRLGFNHPDILARRQQSDTTRQAVASETARVTAAAEADVRAGRARVAALEASLAAAQADMDRDAQAQIPLNAMQRDAEAARVLLQTVLERIQQTTQQAALETADSRVVSAAVPPPAATWPPTPLLMLAAIAIAGVLASALTYLLELSDGTLRGGDDVADALGLPCLALVPDLGRRAKAADHVVLKPASPFAEQIRALRVALWLTPAASPVRVVAVTAARPAEGKTTLCAALGRMVAAHNERVLVIDCDTREPAFSRLMAADARIGLMDVLRGQATLDDVTGTDTLTGMQFVPAGTPDERSLELFLSDAMVQLLAAAMDRYRLVILDAPPAAAMADARVIAHLADATVLCARWRHSPARVVRHTVGLLEAAQARIAGVVLTRVDPLLHRRAGFADSDVYHPSYGGYFRE